MSTWEEVALDFHRHVRANCWDTLGGHLLTLHQPQVSAGLPVCQGCDRIDPRTPPPSWPCRTYALIATIMLGVCEIDTLLRARLAAADARVASPRSPVPTPTGTPPSAPVAAGTGPTRSPRSKT